MRTEPHRANRPSWRCSVDGTPWPCEAARAALIAAYPDTTWLVTHLTRLMGMAAVELGLAGPTVLHQRFVRWALDAEATCQVCGARRHVAPAGVPPRLVPCDELRRSARYVPSDESQAP